MPTYTVTNKGGCGIALPTQSGLTVVNAGETKDVTTIKAIPKAKRDRFSGLGCELKLHKRKKGKA